MNPQDQATFEQNWLKSFQSAAQQPQAQLQETQAAAGAAGASAGLQTIEQQTAQVKAQQAAALQGLGKDLSGNNFTLDQAFQKYSALGLSADDIFKQYIAARPNEALSLNPSQLQNLQSRGVTSDALGALGTPGSFMDRYNTRNAIQGLRDLQNKFSQTSALSKLPFLGGATASGRAYEAARQIFGEHLSSLIPGASAASSDVQSLLNTLPDVGHIGQLEPGAADQQFKTVEDQLLASKGYSPSDLGLQSQSNQSPKFLKSGSDLIKGLLQMALPTAGGIGGGILGGIGGALIPGADLSGVPEVAGAIGGATAGGAGGQALADILTGQKPGVDVAITGGLSGFGEGAGAALGGILGKGGEMLASKIPDNVFDKVISASPNYTTDVSALKDTATRYGLMNGSSSQGLSKMPVIMNNIGDKIQSILSNVKTPVNLSDVNKSILDDFSKQSSAFENTADFENAQKYITNRLFSATGNDQPLSKIISSSGEPLSKTNAQTTYSALYNLKSEVAQDLKPVFKAQANPSMTTNFTPKQEANLALWNGLKNAIDKVSPVVRNLNDDQHNMFDIAKGFVKDATTKKGGGLVGDIFGTLAGNMLGGIPGALAGITFERSLASEGGRAAVSKLLQSGALQQGIRGTGAGIGGALGGILGQ